MKLEEGLISSRCLDISGQDLDSPRQTRQCGIYRELKASSERTYFSQKGKVPEAQPLFLAYLSSQRHWKVSPEASHARYKVHSAWARHRDKLK